MASYGGTQAGRLPRQNQYGHSSQAQRGEAYSNIFGAPPPPGRAQTMVSPGTIDPRLQTISPPINPQPPQNIPIQSQGQPQARFPPPRSQQHPSGYGPPDTYMPPNRQASGGLAVRQPLQPEIFSQTSNERRPGQQPQRIDSRQPSQQTSQQAQQQAPQQAQQGMSTRPIPNRGPPPSAALNSDAFRSRSMATGPGQGLVNPAMNTYNQASAASFRQQPYQGVPGASRTTAQGRIVPARQDERAMSMTTRTPERDYSQTMSGRVIPNRQREQGAQSH